MVKLLTADRRLGPRRRELNEADPEGREFLEPRLENKQDRGLLYFGRGHASRWPGAFRRGELQRRGRRHGLVRHHPIPTGCPKRYWLIALAHLRDLFVGLISLSYDNSFNNMLAS
jgi:hypothetical protein